MNKEGIEAGTIPDSYHPAEWRGTIPADKNTSRIGVAFDVGDGTVLRLSISQVSAKHLIETLSDYLACSHSEMSAGMPSSDVSKPPGGVKV